MSDSVPTEKPKANQLSKEEKLKALKRMKAKKRADDKKKEALTIKSDSKLRFEIKAWNPIGLWTYEKNTDTCAICKESLHSPCVELTAQKITLPTIEEAEQDENTKKMCTVAFGECTHAFHHHCIHKWSNMVLKKKLIFFFFLKKLGNSACY
jgi:E3 ubiquitin-protein ligase RBX1